MHTARTTLLLLLPLALAPFAHARAATTECETKATAMLDALGRKDYAAASRDMGALLRTAPQQKVLISMWEALIRDNWGPYRSHGEGTAAANNGGTNTIRLPLQFDHGATTATITCDPKEGGAVTDFVLL
jgi:hypothetical protein